MVCFLIFYNLNVTQNQCHRNWNYDYQMSIEKTIDQGNLKGPIFALILWGRSSQLISILNMKNALRQIDMLCIDHRPHQFQICSISNV